MCSNYRAVTQSDRLLQYFGVFREKNEVPVDTWPLGLAPFIRLHEDGSGNKVCDDGIFGLLPHFQAEMAAGRKTYNARSETVAKLPSFRDAWKRGQRCIIPAEWIYEPNWETGNAVRWKISRADTAAMGIAGLYTRWTAPDNRTMFTFAMLTVNAEGHPVMRRMQRPEDEKRMVVILDQDEYGPWLGCAVEETTRYFRQWTGLLAAEPAPLPPRAPKTISGRTVVPPPPKDQGDDLF